VPEELDLTKWKKIVPAIMALIGKRGAVLSSLTVIFSVFQAIVEYALALFFMLFLCTLHFIGYSDLPGWLPFDPQSIGPVGIWVVLLTIGVAQAVCQVVNYEAKILFAEGAHARMRLILGYRVLLSREARCMALSEMNLYTAELFPKAFLFIFHLTQAVSFLVQTLLIGIGMFFLAPGETMIGLGGLGIMGCLVLLLNRLTNRLSGRVPEAQKELERSKVRIARNWLLIRVFNLQHHEFDRWVQSVFSYYRHTVLVYLVANLGSALMPVLGIVTIAAIVLVNDRFLQTPVASLVAFLYLFMRFLQMIANGSNLIGGLFTYKLHILKTLELVDSLLPSERQDALRTEDAFSVARPLTIVGRKPVIQDRLGQAPLPAPGIRLEHVTFAWPGSARPILRDVSLELEPGKQLGIVGPNGSGKSTLLGAILGALRPDSGRVFVDGLDSETYLRQAADAAAYVGPEPYLIHGTVRENLLYGLQNRCSEGDIREVLSRVGLDDFFRSLPGGLDYPLAENGDGLSSGQKQRLAMARSFLRRPSLFIMDEPSANLDEATEVCVVAALRELKGQCTVLVVSHRKGILKEADSIYHMEAGQTDGE
jgi:ABC-type multidrug transport system fused ATPase/permease subunit